MLKIYGQARSRTFRVLWLANEAGLQYEHIPVSTMVESAQCKETEASDPADRNLL